MMAVDIEELRELLEDATPGHWTGFPSGVLSGAEWVICNSPVGPKGRIWRNEDQKLVVALHNAAPALLDELDKASAEAERALARILKAEAEAAALRIALREVAIERFVIGVASSVLRCRRCGSKWKVDAPETHNPNCLAAPVGT